MQDTGQTEIIDSKHIEQSEGKARLDAPAPEAPAPKSDNEPEREDTIDATPEEAPSIESLHAIATRDGGTVLYHGGLPDDYRLANVDLMRTGTQQTKKNRAPSVGFYLTDDTPRSREWTENYAKTRNGRMHGFVLGPNAKIDERTDKPNQNIDRISADEAKRLQDEGYDAIHGKDTLGRSQWVLLNKNAVTAESSENINEPTPPEPSEPPVKPTNIRKVVRADDKRKTGGQTKSNFVNHVTGEPMSKSAIGDTFERMFEVHGFEALNDVFGDDVEVFSHAKGETGKTGARNTPLDFRIGTRGVELKSMSTKSNNLKTAIKRKERDRKEAEVAKRGLQPLLLVQVVNQDDHSINIYAHDEFSSTAVKKMDLITTYYYNDADFWQATTDAGYGKTLNNLPKPDDTAIPGSAPSAEAPGAVAASAGWTDETDEPIESGDTVVEILAEDGVPTIYTQSDVVSPKTLSAQIGKDHLTQIALRALSRYAADTMTV